MDENNETTQSTILLVDDEANILSSLRRVLRTEPYRILLATDASQALQLMAANTVDLLISDARMPGMDGVSLLTEVQKRWPDCVRIMLTGYADLATSVKAINEGRVYRYISKPWDDGELKLVIKQALAFQYSERERERLETLTREQNQHLQELNTTLEQRVKERTSELQQTADMLDLAYAELKRSYFTATEVFSNLVSLRLGIQRHGNSPMISLVRAFGREYSLDERLCTDLKMSAALYNIGKLTWRDQLINKHSDLLNKDERLHYVQYPVVGESLLMALDPLKAAAKMIRHHQELWSGGGFPDGLLGEAIPLGSRILKLAVDFIELQRGLILERRLTREEAMSYLARYKGKIYDPALCEKFIELCRDKAPDLDESETGSQELTSKQLKPGMVLAKNLLAQSGMLLLNEGKILTEDLIQKLVSFETSEGAKYVVRIRNPKLAQDSK